MRFNVHFTIRGPVGIIEVPNKTNPVFVPNLAGLLRALADGLPSSSNIGLETVGIRVEPAAEQPAEQPAEEFDPQTGENLTGKTSTCCECGEDYPSADHVVRGDIFCPKCRDAEKARKRP